MNFKISLEFYATHEAVMGCLYRVYSFLQVMKYFYAKVEEKER